MKIDDNRRGKMPQVEAPQEWRSPDGRFRGWQLSLPGSHTLATPAIADGRLFLGGGFGSYEFYALDSITGNLLWQYQTEDDGPTAAVVQEEFVAFNTESCELEILNVEGQRLWKHWLGDPLMSMPAMDNSHVFIAYPDSRNDRQHYLACFERETGQQHWRTPISGEIISAPVLTEERVYLTTLDGTLSCFEKSTGRELWIDSAKATSSPTAFEDQLYFSQRRDAAECETSPNRTPFDEYCSQRAVSAESNIGLYEATRTPAHYLDIRARSTSSPRYQTTLMADAFVGFSGHKGDSKMHQASPHLGRDHVAGIWEYQGSRPVIANRRLYSAMGNSLHCIDIESRESHWKTPIFEAGEAEEIVDHMSTPAVFVNHKVFLGTLQGDLICICGDSGRELWRVALGDAIIFQPAVVRGRVYVPTARGRLFCVETEDAADDGWNMWGGSAQHNGSVK